MPPIEQLRGRQLGRILIKMGILKRRDVLDALEIQKQRGGPLGAILVEAGQITETQLNLALGAQVGMAPIDLNSMDIPQDVIHLIPAQMANTYKIVPFQFDADTKRMHVAISSPDNFRAIDDLKTLMGFDVVAGLCEQSALQSALDKYYPEGSVDSITNIIDEMASDEDLAAYAGRGESIDLAELKEMAEANPVKRLLNLVLLQAIRDKASDIHFEPFEDEFRMRYRIDGVLYDMIPPPRYTAMAIASRIKVMASLDIAERRMPQDGRIELVVEGNPIDLRVAVLPTMFGESVVMRVLDRSNVQLDLDKIGLRDDDHEVINQLINKPNGIVIVTGPTGSGKTTTLYAALSTLNSPEVKILTAEDPVEYDIDGLVQIQVRSEVGLTFARALRSFLRQDPDIILVGEIRDLETAQISVQAALTGHLVFSTLHTNDAPSSIARLLDLGLEAFLVTATVEGIVAQRLVRRICKNCRAPYEPTDELLMELNLTRDDLGDRTLFYGKGCDYCNNTGYRGRLAIFELLVMNDDLRELVMRRASTTVIRAQALKSGMRSLREAGIMAIYDGMTTIEEVVRETIIEE
ncbi:MAG: Flp pilus assembly complex ATPase component TadA [Phycisphaerales bacterium]|nr:Flp pilus assembly complex ATPase component TadA [Phycisphaerales bacterium]